MLIDYNANLFYNYGNSGMKGGTWASNQGGADGASVTAASLTGDDSSKQFWASNSSTNWRNLVNGWGYLGTNTTGAWGAWDIYDPATNPGGAWEWDPANTVTNGNGQTFTVPRLRR